MSRVKINEERCKGCFLCTLVCPEQVLASSERFNQQGYKVVEIAAGKKQDCKGCAFCAQICPDCAIAVWRTKEVKKGKA